jgi:hypothetical protein
MASTDVLAAPGGGFYCSTSGTTFASKDALQEHYRSDFHRYNLKRKVAGLPPVTREWFEARKAQLASSDAAKSAAAERVRPPPTSLLPFILPPHCFRYIFASVFGVSIWFVAKCELCPEPGCCRTRQHSAARVGTCKPLLNP